MKGAPGSRSCDEGRSIGRLVLHQPLRILLGQFVVGDKPKNFPAQRDQLDERDLSINGWIAERDLRSLGVDLGLEIAQGNHTVRGFHVGDASCRRRSVCRGDHDAFTFGGFGGAM